MKKWLVMYVDKGDTCDGKPRNGGLFDTYIRAHDWVVEDIATFARSGSNGVDYEKMKCDDCVWNIEEIEV